jgi:pentatricopeptide repeat protein
MASSGLERSAVTYSGLLSACERAARWDAGLRLFDSMARDGVPPAAGMYASLARACANGACAASLLSLCLPACLPDCLSLSLSLSLSFYPSI